MKDDGFLLRRVYTDAPILQTGLFMGSFRLLFWLFFHPSAWCNHLARVDDSLRPDFCLAELGLKQWRSTAFWRLLLMLYLAWPLLVAMGVAIGLWLLAAPPESLLVGVILGVAAGILTSVAVSVAGSVAIGTAVGMAVGMVVGVGSLVFTTASSLSFPSAALSLDTRIGSFIGLASGLSGGLSYGITSGLTRSKTAVADSSLTRQLSGAIVGILIGGLAGWLVGLVTENWAAGLVVGLPFGLAVGWRTNQPWRGVMGGLAVGLAGSLATVLAQEGAAGLLGGVAFVALVSSLFALPYVLAERVAGPWAGALAGALGSGGGFFLFVTTTESVRPLLLFSLLGILLGLTLAWWRPVVTYPFLAAWNILLLRLDERRLVNGRFSLLPWHSAFWDELQRLPLLGLEDHLLLLLTHQPTAGEAAIDYLSSSQQRWAAQAAQIELDARRLEQCVTVTAVGEAHTTLAAGELAGPASALLRSFSRISQDVNAALRQESAYNQRLALHTVEDRLDGLLRELTRSNEPYAARFRPIAAEWRQLVAAQNQTLAEEAELRQEIDSPYIIGVPLTEQQQIFVGRTEISARIEQLLLDRRQPPLLLYGQRRVGKTSLLNNLGRLLPSTILPLFVDLQGPASRAADEVGFLYNLGRGMSQSAARRNLLLPVLERETLTADPFTRFEEWLDEVEATLVGQMVLLMLDEFEVLAGALAKGKFEETAVLGMLRHLIQHRPRFKVLLSGSHTLDEFERWASYLINVQLVHIGYLSEAEAQQLIEQPVRDFALRYEPAAMRRVFALTRGHPFLVQLLCAELVALKNEQPPTVRRLAQVADVETAVPLALTHGSFFFADIKQNQVNLAESELLRLLAAHGEGVVVPRQVLVAFFPSLLTLEQALTRLQNQELIESLDGGYRFQVELVRRWFEQRG